MATMPIDDLDIYRTANVLIENHGKFANVEAGKRA